MTESLPPTSTPRRNDERIWEFAVGRARVHPLVQLHYRIDPVRFFPQIASHPLDPQAWYLQSPYADDGRLNIDMGGFLIRTPTRNVLVDAGIGNDKSRPNPNFHQRNDPWLPLMDRLGIHQEQIDTVIFTHLHVDHVGFATTLKDGSWVPTFPNAEYLTTAAELDFWTGTAAERDRERLGHYIDDSIRPLQEAGLLRLVAPDHVIDDEIRLLDAPGHTPGNVCVELCSDERRAVFSGDMIHHPLQLALPDWSTDYCVDQDLSTGARRRLLTSLGPDDLLFPAHFPGARPGRVRPTGSDGFSFAPEQGSSL